MKNLRSENLLLERISFGSVLNENLLPIQNPLFEILFEDLQIEILKQSTQSE